MSEPGLGMSVTYNQGQEVASAAPTTATIDLCQLDGQRCLASLGQPVRDFCLVPLVVSLYSMTTFIG